MKPGEWHHVAVVCDPRYDGEARFYVDGKPAGAKPLDLGIPLALSAYRLGAWSSWPDNNFHGALDDVRLYRGLLTDAEVATLAQRADVMRTSDVRRPTPVEEGSRLGDLRSRESDVGTLPGRKMSP